MNIKKTTSLIEVVLLKYCIGYIYKHFISTIFSYSTLYMTSFPISPLAYFYFHRPTNYLDRSLQAINSSATT